MARYILRRLIFLFFTLWVVSIVVFSLSRVAGDPRLMYLSRFTTQERWDEWGRVMGLDKPLPVQYLVWAGKSIRGDLGNSLHSQSSVTEAIVQKLPASVQLASATIIFALIGIPLGILSAVSRGSVWDYAGRFFALLGQALPPFWVGLMLILIFAVELGWLPSAKKGGIDHYILPSITVGWGTAAGILRLVRSSMLNVLDEEYVKLARAKGASRQAVIWKHALKNAAIPPLTFGGLILAGLFTGAVVTESIFGWPGVGRAAVVAVNNNDFPMLAGLVLFFTMVFVFANLLVDVLYASIDPRIRYS